MIGTNISRRLSRYQQSCYNLQTFQIDFPL
jgi:hypothetical protein